jgi:hypothetical protein
MSAPPLPALEANQRGLAAALADVRGALERHAAGAGAEPRAAGNGHPGTGPAASSAATEPAMALDALCGVLGLSPFERAVLVMCAGMELDARFAAVCAAAQGDPARGCPTFGLALAALPEPHWSALIPDAPLRRWRLVELGAGGLTTAPLQIDERVLHHLAGVGHLDERLAGVAEPVPSDEEPTVSQRAAVDSVVRAWRASDAAVPVVQLCGPDPTARRTVACAACTQVGVELVRVVASRLPEEPRELTGVARLCERECALTGSALLVDVDEDGEPSSAAVDQFVQMTAVPLLLSAREPRRILHRPSAVVETGRPSVLEQRALWRRELGADDTTADALAGQFDLDPATIRTARRQAGGASPAAVWDACRLRARPSLDGVAQRVEPGAGWDDLVLPDAALAVLRQVVASVAHRLTVYEDWGLGRVGGSRGLGTSVLFSGPSGTGKTFAAEVLAAELRLDLYRVDLSQVVSKYIGETEKNLRRVFDAADQGGVVLLFDEADALFGKRSEVRDSHDRYANIEVSYLLQRMESYRGLAILTTNLRDALDPAFLRRIRFTVTFPFPGPELRREIWRRAFPPATPTVDLRLDSLARLNVTGGNIRNIAVNAAFLAAAASEPVSMLHLAQAARSEYAKLDKPLTAAEIGGWT